MVLNSNFFSAHSDNIGNNNTCRVVWFPEEPMFGLLHIAKHFWHSENVMGFNKHPHYEIIYTFGGRGKVLYKNIQHDVNCGDIVIFAPDVAHKALAVGAKEVVHTVPVLETGG